jgi:GT2 family glycosyltransferase
LSSRRDVSIILVSWNAAAHLPRCLDSLAELGSEVIVVDNASTDGSAAIVANRYPWVRLVREPVNRGFAGGVNAGARASRGPWLLVLNCDTVAGPQAVERLLEVFDRHPACAAVGGSLIGDDGLPQHGFHVRRFPTLASWWIDLWLLDAVWPRNPVTRRYRAVDLTEGAAGPVEVDQPAGACLMVRRDVFEALGGFDERFHPAWFEDVDFCLRVRRAGYSIFYAPGAVFRHAGGAARQQIGLAAFSRAFYRNLQRYARKHGGPGRLVVVKALIASGMMLRAAVVLPRGRWRDALGYAAVARDAVAWWDHQL